METANTPWLDIPKAILLGALIIGIGLGLGLGIGGNNGTQAPRQAVQEEQLPTDVTFTMDDDEHVKGNRDADIILVEYSDYDCPFCARVHPTLETLVAESDGTVAWAYRHFPLQQIHPQAFGKAVSAECIAAELGNDAFWDYTDSVIMGGEYDDLGAATDCAINPSRENEKAVQDDIERALENGVRGTPFVIVWNQKTQQGVGLSGAQPIEIFRQAIDALK